MSDTGLRELERRHAATGDLFDFQRLLAADARAKGSAVELRPYQVEAIAAFLAGLDKGVTRSIVQLPTGTGKTVTAMALARRLGARTLWLAHREELTAQAADACARVWPEARVGIVKAELDQHEGRDVVIASVQTLAREARLARVLASGAFGLVIADEAHHAPAATWTRVLEVLGCFRRPPLADLPVPLLGLTATPEREDERGLGDVFQATAFVLTLRDAVAGKFLVPWRSVSVELPIRAEALEIARNGEFTEQSLGAELLRAGAAEATARALVEHAGGRELDLADEERLDVAASMPPPVETTEQSLGADVGYGEEPPESEGLALRREIESPTFRATRKLDRRAIVFTVTVDQARRTAEALRALGIAAEHLSGATPSDARREILARLKSGATQVVCNAQVLTEGFDEPTVSCVVVARPTRGRGLYVQMVGRGLRLAEGKADCLVVDLVGAADLGIVSAADLATSDQKRERVDVWCVCDHGRAAHGRDPENAKKLGGCRLETCDCERFSAARRRADPAARAASSCVCGHVLREHVRDGGRCEAPPVEGEPCPCDFFERSRIEASLVSGFVNQAAARSRRELAWVPGSADAHKPSSFYALGVADHGTVVLIDHGHVFKGQGEGWGLWRLEKDKLFPPQALAPPQPLEEAFAFAATWVRDEGLARFAAADASWRSGPVSAGQRSALEKWRLRPRDGASKGEAADLLTRAAVRARIFRWTHPTTLKVGGPPA